MGKASISRFLMTVILFLMVVLAIVFGFIKPSLFMTNPYFNGTIVSIWFFGVVVTCQSLVALWREERVFYQKSHGLLNILRPLVVLYERSPQADEAMVHAVLDRCYQGWNHDFLRYLTGSMIFLGLLGTLWGLSETIVAISDVIGHLPAQDAAEGFLETLKTKLQQPLAGMGVAFSSSLLGVAGTLTMGFLSVQLDRAKDCFFEKAEWWARSLFPSMDRPMHAFEKNGDVSLARWVDGIERLGRLYLSAEKRQTEWLEAVIRLGEKNQSMVEWMGNQTILMNRLAEESTLNRQVLERMSKKLTDVYGANEEMKSHLGHITGISQELLRHVADHSWVDVVRQELSVYRRIQVGDEKTPASKAKHS